MSSQFSPSTNEVVETYHPPQTQDITYVREQIADIVNKMVNLDLGNSSHTDDRKELRSDQVWEHFESHQGVDGTEWAVCNYCMKKLVGSIRTGTKHLENHFERCRKRRKTGGRGGDDEPAEAGNWLTNPIPMKEESMICAQDWEFLRKARMIIKHGDTSSLKSIKVDYIIQVYKEEKERLHTYIENLSCRLCLKINKYGKYFWLSVHFINKDWEMWTKIISLRTIEEDFDIINCFKDVLLEWGVDKKISSVIDYHVYEEDLADKFVMNFNKIKSWFSDGISLPSSWKMSYFYFFDNLIYYSWNLTEDLNRDVFEKISKIYNYVEETSSNAQNFQIAIERAKSLGKEVTAKVIPRKKKNCWGWRNKKCLEIAIGYKEAFLELEKMDMEFKLINLTKEEWDLTTTFNDCYKELNDDAIKSRHRTCHIANIGFILLCELYNRSLLLEKFHPLFYDDKILNRFRNLMDEYWSKNHLVLAAVVVLDPRFKLDIVEHWYKKIYGSKYETQVSLFKDYFTNVYNEYVMLDPSEKLYKSSTSYTMLDPSEKLYKSSTSYTMLDPLGKPCRSSKDFIDASLQKSELDLYLQEFKFPSIEKLDILDWWRVNNKYFPTLAKMARDFLSIKLSSKYPLVVQKDLDKFDSEGLDGDMVREAFICTKSWLESHE